MRGRWREKRAGGGNCRFLNSTKNLSQVFVAQHIGSADAQRTNALLCEPGLPPLIMARLGCGIMCPTVDLDRQTRGRAVKIENIGTDWMLPAEAEASHLSAS